MYFENQKKFCFRISVSVFSFPYLKIDFRTNQLYGLTSEEKMQGVVVACYSTRKARVRSEKKMKEVLAIHYHAIQGFVNSVNLNLEFLIIYC